MSDSSSAESSLPFTPSQSAFTPGRYVKTGNISTYYESYGAGQPVIVVPGDPASLDLMRNFHLLTEKHRVIFYDRRGLGRTADTYESWTYRDLADDLAELMTSLDLKSSHIIGHSAGACIGLEFALAHPDRIKSLVSIGGNYNPNCADREFLERLKTIKPHEYSPELLANQRELAQGDVGRFERVFEKLRKLWLSEPNLTLDDLGRIKCPTLIVSGDDDTILLSHTIHLFEHIPNSELFIMPDTQHYVFSEKPLLVIPIVGEFIARHNAID